MHSLRHPILVSGGGRGIGRAISLRLARAGRDLIIHYGRDRASACQTAQECAELGVRAELVPADLASPSGVTDLGRAVLAQVDGRGGLVNNAGVYEGHDLPSTSTDLWDRVLAINLRAPFFLLRDLAPALRRGSGAVVNVSSILGVTASPGAYPYQASKAGLTQLTRSLATDLAPAIRVNGVFPGFTRTDINRAGWEDGSSRPGSRQTRRSAGGGNPRMSLRPWCFSYRMTRSSSPARCWGSMVGSRCDRSLESLWAGSLCSCHAIAPLSSETLTLTCRTRAGITYPALC